MVMSRGKKPRADFFSPRIPTRSTNRDGEGADTGLEEILRGQKEIMNSLQNLHNKVDKVEKSVADLDSRMGKVEQGLQEMGGKVKHMETTVADLTQKMGEVDSRVNETQVFKQKARDSFLILNSELERLENERRGANVRVIGMPPLSEGEELKSTLQPILDSLLPETHPKASMEIKRAYRLPTTKRDKANRKGEGTVMLVLANPEGREVVLRAAAVKKMVQHRGSRLLFFPEVSRETQDKRRSLLDLRKELLGLGLRASVFHPARLKVAYREQPYSFSQVETAQSFVRRVRDEIGVPQDDTDQTE